MGRWRPRYRSRSSNRSYSGRSYNYGAERAREHIEAARALTIELGGADQKVKQWLFGLPQYELARILDAYEKAFGASKRAYAEQVIPKWRSGAVQMSGMVAERLFKLLPHFMPLSLKYEVTEGLWRHFGPSSRKTLWIGPDADMELVVTKAREHVEAVVTSYRIPDNLQERFDWLAGNDVGVKQDLLNHLRSIERELVVTSARQHVPVLLQHLRGDEARHTSRAAHVLKVGNHELELIVDRNALGVQDTAPPKPSFWSRPSSAGPSATPDQTARGASSGWWWLLGLLIIAGVLKLGNTETRTAPPNPAPPSQWQAPAQVTAPTVMPRHEHEAAEKAAREAQQQWAAEEAAKADAERRAEIARQEQAAREAQQRANDTRAREDAARWRDRLNPVERACVDRIERDGVIVLTSLRTVEQTAGSTRPNGGVGFTLIFDQTLASSGRVSRRVCSGHVTEGRVVVTRIVTPKQVGQ
jgi:hypothetical protein